jgi:hypothetical protein
MALIDLLNNDPNFFYYSGQGNFTQRSIPYGNDQPGGGSSNQPFIQFPLPEDAGPDTKRYYELNRSGNDFPLRGGSGLGISSLVPIIPSAAVIDKDRIRKFYSTSEGNIFLQKQRYLQYANPKMEVGQALQPFGQQIGTLIQGGTEYTRVYNNGKNTLEQVGVMGSGIHFDRHGLVPINPFQLSYDYVVKNKAKDLNRLVSLYRSKITSNGINILSLNSNSTNLGISPDPTLLFEYPGGPDSIGGIGFTTIERKVISDFDPSLDVNQGIYTFNYNQLSQASDNNYRQKGIIKQDFRAEFNGAIPSSNYDSGSIEVKYKIGTKIGDEVNKPGNVYKFIASDIDPWDNITNTYPVSTEDLIRFGFEAINYDPVGSIFVQFRAFISSFSDNNSAEYSSVKYIGRGETFYGYTGFTRNINFGFIIAALSKNELLPIYEKLNILLSQIYPDYGSNSFMRTPVVKMTIGNYIYRQPGFLNSMNLSIETDYPWEITDDRQLFAAQLPHVIKAECQFTPIHDFLPRRSQNGRVTPLINQRTRSIDPAKTIGVETTTGPVNTQPLIPLPR